MSSEPVLMEDIFNFTPISKPEKEDTIQYMSETEFKSLFGISEPERVDYEDDYKKLLEKNRELMSSLTKMLECPVCLNIVRTTPVPSCYNGHILCSSCWYQVHLCPLCRVKLHKAEKCFSQTANTLLEVITLPCPYQEEGCMAVGMRKVMEEHAKECLYKVVEDTVGRSCSVPGCHVGKRNIKTTPTTTPSTTTPSTTVRRHCGQCNRDFSRGYFTRHVCLQGIWRDQHV